MTMNADPTQLWAARHYFLYWKLSPDERLTMRERRIVCAANNHLQRTKPGDVLWLVNVYRSQLWLVGRLAVAFVVDDTEIAQTLVAPDDESWQEADWYAIANPYHVETMRDINITSMAPDIRFNSESDQLDWHAGLDAKQLFHLRELTPATANLVEQAWNDDAYEPRSLEDYLELLEDDASYVEGRKVVLTVRQRQRSRTLVESAKQRFRMQHGRLFCQGCGFDFADVYGIEYIEAHHPEQLASYTEERETNPDELIMLCANCHRVAHTRVPPFSLDELKQLITTRQGRTP